jgi:ABC-type sugar transport system ATPase subunit
MSIARSTPSTPSTPTLVACRGVTVLHGRSVAQVTALRDIDFELGEGERVALFGPSGSGKTTLLHVLGGLIVPDRGEVTWHEAPLPSLQSRASRRGARIALVFQNANLLPTFTAFENVAFAVNAAGDRDQAGPGAEHLHRPLESDDPRRPGPTRVVRLAAAGPVLARPRRHPALIHLLPGRWHGSRRRRKRPAVQVILRSSRDAVTQCLSPPRSATRCSTPPPIQSPISACSGSSS